LNNKIANTPIVPTTNDTPKASGKKVLEDSAVKRQSTNTISDLNDLGIQQKISSVYESRKNKIAIEEDLDKLIKEIMPDLGVKFKIHDSGQVITSVINNQTEEVIREFPAEKILDLVHSMCAKLGIVVNKKV